MAISEDYKKKYVPLLVSLLVAALLLTVLVIRLVHKLDTAPKSPNEFGTFYKTLRTKTQSYFD